MARRLAKGAQTIRRTPVPVRFSSGSLDQSLSISFMLATGVMLHSLRLTASPVAELSAPLCFGRFRLIFYSFPAPQGWNGQTLCDSAGICSSNERERLSAWRFIDFLSTHALIITTFSARRVSQILRLDANI